MAFDRLKSNTINFKDFGALVLLFDFFLFLAS